MEQIVVGHDKYSTSQCEVGQLRMLLNDRNTQFFSLWFLLFTLPYIPIILDQLKFILELESVWISFPSLQPSDAIIRHCRICDFVMLMFNSITNILLVQSLMDVHW